MRVCGIGSSPNPAKILRCATLPIRTQMAVLTAFNFSVADGVRLVRSQELNFWPETVLTHRPLQHVETVVAVLHTLVDC